MASLRPIDLYHSLIWQDGPFKLEIRGSVNTQNRSIETHRHIHVLPCCQLELESVSISFYDLWWVMRPLISYLKKTTASSLYDSTSTACQYIYAWNNRELSVGFFSLWTKATFWSNKPCINVYWKHKVMRVCAWHTAGSGIRCWCVCSSCTQWWKRKSNFPHT
jgi:hypothetical protein